MPLEREESALPWEEEVWRRTAVSFFSLLPREFPLRVDLVLEFPEISGYKSKRKKDINDINTKQKARTLGKAEKIGTLPRCRILGLNRSDS